MATYEVVNHYDEQNRFVQVSFLITGKVRQMDSHGMCSYTFNELIADIEGIKREAVKLEQMVER